MESPVFQPTLPFRPIPIYGQRSQLSTAGTDMPSAQAQIPASSHENHLMLAKHINLISQMGRLKALGEYQLNHARHPGNIAPAHILHDANKFGVKNLAMVGNIGQSQAMLHSKVQNLQQPKLFDFDVTKTHSDVNLAPHVNHVNSNHAVIDRMTVPVIVSCANPFTSQYGYGRKVFPCPQCRYTTDRRNNLKRHMLTMHQTCAKTLECCGIVFATKASLREHAMIFHYHGYTCFYCGRRFCRKALLKRHLSVHNGQKDFVCPVCDYATSHKSNLERHRKVHCRPEDRKPGELDCGEEDEVTWRSEDHGTDDNNNQNILSSSDDESEEINVDSD
ncbi:zinc finger protein 543-like isoform X1 [Mercenaria mercenaria]|uniref:zinc finger protein 543-like isoform X1 n=2 Tax=Mercenaria mercenaria TaxID=6596 RepID=UPI00234EF26C|nr:zinc finger protein 543-like isoform X1 [Mercenaria mercenaria]